MDLIFSKIRKLIFLILNAFMQRKIVYSKPTSKDSFWIGIWVDNFDKGGLEEVVANLATEISKKGIDIRVICNGPKGYMANILISKGICVECFDNNENTLRNYLYNDKPLLLNTHYTQKFLRISQELDIPLIETIHTTYLLNNKQWKLEKKRAKYFSQFIAVSKFVGEYYKSKIKYADKENITIINNAANYEKLKGSSSDNLSRNDLGLDNNETVFLNVGSYYGIKNQLGLVYAFEIALSKGLINSSLIMCGNILDKDYYKILNDFISKSKFKHKYFLLDYNSDIKSIYSISDILVIPSYVEGWSIAATEALYCGLALIHTDCGSANELCTNEYSKIIPNPFKDLFKKEIGKKLYKAQLFGETNNTNELVEAMLEFYEKRNEIKENRQKIAADSIAMFSLDKMVQGYIDVFSKYL